jgi:ribosomal protein S18 acetylase RimI-like enzyme
VNFRLYAPGDFERLYSVEQRCFPPQLRFSRRYLRQIVRSPQTATWVAEADSLLAGFAVAAFATKTNGVAAYLETIEVLSAFRGQGVGAELLRRVEASAAAAAAGILWLHVDIANQHAIRFYQAHGYSSEGIQEDYYPDGNAALIYRKPLSNGSLP